MKKDFVKKTLKNGITVYLYRDKSLKKTVVSYNVKYGTLGYYDKFYYKNKMYEMPPAMAHFLEHTLIEESKYGNMLHKFKKLNYEVNGATYPELTSYYFVGIKDVRESLKELINMVDDPVFDERAIENVKSAIIEEVNKNDDDKYRIAFNIARRNLFQNFEAIRDCYNSLGTKESTSSITYEQARICYDAYYNDENKFLCIGGNFETEEMLSYLESIYAELKPHRNEMREYDYGSEFAVRKTYEEIKRPVDTDYIITKYKFKNDFEENQLLLDLYFYLFLRLKFASDTPFVTELIEKKIIHGGISSDVDFFNGIIDLTFSTEVLDKEAYEEALQKRLNADDLDDEYRFELIKKALKVSELSKMDYIYGNLVRFPVGIEFSEKLYTTDMLDDVTLRDVKKFIEKLTFDTKTVSYIKRKEVD